MHIRKAAVLGAGVMGAQIAAHLVNSGIPTILFDLPAKEGHPNGIILQAIARLKKLKPAPLGMSALADIIEPANYETDLAKLKDCDFIIEAVAERLDIKENLYTKIAPFIHEHALIASNTSGLSIDSLASVLPESIQPQFCGVHFFNPPRYMTLVEITPHSKTNPKVLDQLETFLTSSLGKGVIRAKDTPNFVANRIGVFAILAMMHRAIEFGLPFEVVDQLTGKDFGRAKSALYRTLDVVGLDVMAHVVETMTNYLPHDPWHRYYQVPQYMKDLIAQGALGQKSGSGFYQKQGKAILVYDPTTKNYRAADQQADSEVLAILKIKNVHERLAKLRASHHPQAQFLYLCLSDLFLYCAYHVADIAHNVRDLDLAMRWGFGWREGVFELWQSAHWQDVIEWLVEDLKNKKSLVDVELPVWVSQVASEGGVYLINRAYNPSEDDYEPRSKLPVYQRQLFPDPVITEKFNEGDTLFETEAVRLWTLDQQVAILSFKSKMCAVGDDVLDGVIAALEVAQREAKAMVIWQRNGDNFSVGANLKQVGEVYAQKGIDGIRPIVEKFQRASMALKYSSIPVVAAVKGMALGGGCEFVMHCDRVVAAFESYMGLVEVGVGLLPAGGGCKEFALRAFQEARGDDPFRDMKAYFKQIAMGEVTSSALDAKQRGYLRQSDVIVMNPYEILYVAIQQAIALANSGYRPPLAAKIPAIGKPGIADFQMLLVNMHAGQFISDYDLEISLDIAKVLCGGEIEGGSMVDEEWYLRLEREYFLKLAAQPKTQARIEYMLKNGKPLRN